MNVRRSGFAAQRSLSFLPIEDSSFSKTPLRHFYNALKRRGHGYMASERVSQRSTSLRNDSGKTKVRQIQWLNPQARLSLAWLLRPARTLRNFLSGECLRDRRCCTNSYGDYAGGPPEAPPMNRYLQRQEISFSCREFCRFQMEPACKKDEHIQQRG